MGSPQISAPTLRLKQATLARRWPEKHTGRKLLAETRCRRQCTATVRVLNSELAHGGNSRFARLSLQRVAVTSLASIVGLTLQDIASNAGAGRGRNSSSPSAA